MSKLLFVTSFSPDLYEASGRHLLDSFRSVQSHEQRLLICREGDDYPNFAAEAQFIEYRLNRDLFLNEWLEANCKHIPDYLGGKATACDCPDREKVHAKHSPRCHWQFMNRNASRFFRKVASWRAAADFAGRSGVLVWLDADVRLCAGFDVMQALRILDRSGIAYCRGHRPAVESGVVLFDLDRGGMQVIEDLCQRYASKRYLKDERWDDGYQLARVIEAMDRGVGLDLVHPTKYKGKTNNVIPTTVLAEFVIHDKGKHTTQTGMRF